MKLYSHYLFFLAAFIVPLKQFGQHHSTIEVAVHIEDKTLTSNQVLEFYNQTGDTLTSIVLNDWNNAYSSKNSPLAKRFSDEFYRAFHVASSQERGSTTIKNITANNSNLLWERTVKNPDYIIVTLAEKLAPNEKLILRLNYITKVASDKFSSFGYDDTGGMYLKNWFLTPARYENHSFVKYNNLNLDDIANAISNFDISFQIPLPLQLTTDLNELKITKLDKYSIYTLKGVNRTDFNIFLERKSSFSSYKNKDIEVLTNVKGYKADEIQKANAIDKVVNFTSELVGKVTNEKITVSQADYDKNPFYGLNQLPSILTSFPDDFLFELKFLKTYLNNFLSTHYKLDPRKDNWIYDGIQIYTMIRYIDKYYPKAKMTGRIASFKILKGFHLLNLDFNEQYSYLYLLMARKNLDQPLATSKDNLIKFNQQISSKYKAGLSLVYLDNFLSENSVPNSIIQFTAKNTNQLCSRTDFETALKSKTTKDIDWFFETIIDSRKIIDYTFKEVTTTKDSITFSLKSKANIYVPVPIYGLKKDSIVFKKWFEPHTSDTTYSVERNQANKIVINYKDEVPEFNLRNNWKKLNGFSLNSRPFRFTFVKDLEDPYHNQIIFAPILTYNLYDGLSPGLRFHNKSILNRPFVYDINPTYSTTSKSVTGSASLLLNKDYRDRSLFNIKYSLSANYFHYAADAAYLKLNPMVVLQFRNNNFRDNQKQFLFFRQVIIDREKSNVLVDSSLEDYSLFNVRYGKSRMELTKTTSFMTDLQFAGQFGKISTEMQYRKLFEDNRLLSLRVFAGAFTYNSSDSDFFSFAIDRPTDYLFDYAYLGRSSQTGFASQEFILAEGGFKSKLNPSYANKWITTFNASYSIWNWIEAYGDLGFVKNTNQKSQVLFDSGIRLNLLPDYFELFLPIYSSNGWEITQPIYNEKIRFVVTLNPSSFSRLFTRKWF